MSVLAADRRRVHAPAASRNALTAAAPSPRADSPLLPVCPVMRHRWAALRSRSAADRRRLPLRSAARRRGRPGPRPGRRLHPSTAHQQPEPELRGGRDRRTVQGPRSERADRDAGTLETERQFRRIIGYADLAKLVIAIERETHRPTIRTPPDETATLVHA
jgi:hypothetical protein